MFFVRYKSYRGVTAQDQLHSFFVIFPSNAILIKLVSRTNGELSCRKRLAELVEINWWPWREGQTSRELSRSPMENRGAKTKLENRTHGRERN